MASGRRPTYANAHNRSTKVQPDFVDVMPGKAGAVAADGQSFGIDFSEVYKVDHSQNPLLQMKEALKTGKTKVDMGETTPDGKPILREVNVTGVHFNVVDARTKLRVQKESNLEEARQVFQEGKDETIFSPRFIEVQKAAHERRKFVETLRKKYKEGIDEAGLEVLTEDFDNGLYSTPSSWQSPNISDNPDAMPWDANPRFTPLGNGPMNQQLYLHDQWAMIAKAFEAYHRNPYANRAIEIIVNFVLGRGFSILFHEPILQEMWDNEAENIQFNEQVYVWLRDLERAGELFLRPIFDPITGDMVEIQSLEASTILEVITDPYDLSKVHGYYQQYLSPIQIYGDDAERTAQFIVNTYSADEIIHVKVNNTGSEKRGRSSLFPVFEYLKMIRDYHVAAANKAIAGACLIFDWAIAGAPTDVSNFANSIPPINFTKPIQNVFHSENSKLQAVASPGQNRTRDEALESLINAIAVGTGIGREYLGSSMPTSRTSSLSTTEPATKQFEQRQRIVAIHIIGNLTKKWIAAKIAAGAVQAKRLMAPKEKLHAAIGHIRNGEIGKAISKLYSALMGRQEEIDLDRAVDVTFPEIVKGDLAQMLENYAFMQAMGWWSPERAATMATNEFGNVKGWNYLDEQQEIVAIGIKPIAAKMAQVLMCDKDNPPNQPGGFDNNAQDKPAPQSHQPPRSSNKNNYWNNVRNNVAGAGAAHVRKAVSKESTHFGLFRRMFRNE